MPPVGNKMTLQCAHLLLLPLFTTNVTAFKNHKKFPVERRFACNDMYILTYVNACDPSICLTENHHTTRLWRMKFCIQ